ncbi:MAG TPA: cytochrome c [Candidatus Binataceae bacterium]|nr:cytochrome c [Candidatus Binataceae bacterium]
MSSNRVQCQQFRSMRGFVRLIGVIGITAALMLSAAFAVTQAFAQDESDYLATPTPAPWRTPTAEEITQGKADFIKHCAPCHSASGKGNGPEVKVIPGIKPKDLTKIAVHNGGVFPYQQVEDIIDGRKVIPSHKRFDMPFWGVNFQQQGREFTSASELKAKERIDAIVGYIATIQEN